jgi:flagellar basal body rod protein FlgC
MKESRKIGYNHYNNTLKQPLRQRDINAPQVNRPKERKVEVDFIEERPEAFMQRYQPSDNYFINKPKE